MAIENLSGNFQPLSVDSGRSLPQTSGRAPATTNEGRGTGLDNANVTSSLPSAVTKASVSSFNTQLVEVTKDNKSVENESEVKSQIEELEQFNQSIDRTLEFKVDEELGVTIVRVIDRETDELIRQFPPEELINLSRRLKELTEQDTGSSGILLQEKV